jgi:nicotinate-nucleotide adenylyltransferase
MAGLIGVFGGTFDPPHLGHLTLAYEGLTNLDLEKVLWVLTPVPPHKPDLTLTPLEIRIEMTSVAASQEAKFELSRADIDRPPPHYALGTMEWLSKKYAQAAFVYLMGSDSLRDLYTWHQASKFVDLCAQIGVLERPGAELDLIQLEEKLPGTSRKVKIFSGPSIDITAREIRARVKAGSPFDFLLPRGIAEIIQQNHLYL